MLQRSSGRGDNRKTRIRVRGLAPFAQIDRKLARAYEGTGLGLPLAKSFVELHGGTLTVASAPGGGTTVTARFPGLLVDETIAETQAVAD